MNEDTGAIMREFLRKAGDIVRTEREKRRKAPPGFIDTTTLSWAAVTLLEELECESERWNAKGLGYGPHTTGMYMALERREKSVCTGKPDRRSSRRAHRYSP